MYSPADLDLLVWAADQPAFASIASQVLGPVANAAATIRARIAEAEALVEAAASAPLG